MTRPLQSVEHYENTVAQLLDEEPFNALLNKSLGLSVELANLMEENPHFVPHDFPREWNYPRKEEAVTIIAKALQEFEIIFPNNVINIKGNTERRRLFVNLFEAALLSHLANEQLSYFQYLHNKNAAHADVIALGTEKATNQIAAAEKTLRDMQQKQKIKTQLLSTQTIGDGNCLYHATTANLIYNIFQDKIQSSSLRLFETNLVPYLREKAQEKGITFRSNASLKNIFITLIRAYSPEENHPEHCNFAALSTQIVVPALKKMVFAKGIASNMQQALMPLMISIFESDFRQFIAELKNNPDLDPRNFNSGEFSDIDAEERELLLMPWKNFLEQHSIELNQIEAIEVKSEHSNYYYIDTTEVTQRLYQTFWQRHGEAFYQQYFDMRRKADYMGGPIQQAAMCISLGVEFREINRSNGESANTLQAYINDRVFNPPLDNPSIINIKRKGAHFEARLGEYGKPADIFTQKLSQSFSASHSGPRDLRDEEPRIIAEETPAQKPASKRSAATSSRKPQENSASAPAVRTPVSAPKFKKLQRETEALAKDLERHTIENLSPNQLDREILTAARNRYRFHANPSSPLSTQEEADRQLAIRLQNAEIRKFLNRR